MPGGSRERQPEVVEDCAWACAAALAGRQFGVRTALIMDLRGRSTRASGTVLEARRAALYLTATALNQTGRALCRATGMDHKTIKHHLSAVEDDRELRLHLDALYDEMTGRLQVGLAALLSELEAEPAPVVVPLRLVRA